MSSKKPKEADKRSNIEKIKDESKQFGGWLGLILTEYKILISALVFLGIAGTGGYWVAIGNPLPRIPTWVWLYLFLMGLVGIMTWPVQTRDIRAIEDAGVIIHDVAPKTGDFGVYDIVKELFEDITVKAPADIDEDGEVVYEETDKSALTTVNCKHGVAYECTQYDPDENTAYVTWTAGATPTQIRASKKLIKKIETRMSLLADAGIQEAIERPEVIREVAAQVTLYLVESHQKATLPEGDKIAGVVTSALQKQLDVDPTQIDRYVQNNTPEEYNDIKQNGSVNMESEHRMQASGGAVDKNTTQQGESQA